MNIDMETLHAVGNKLTDVTEKGIYKKVNPYIWSAYYGLPHSLSKLASIIFNFILKTKLYGDGVKGKDIIDEDRRIYTDITIIISDVLNEWDHPKYSKNQDMSANISNMNKRIRELDDNNVFYCWKYKNVYMFVMERDFRTWKFYNSRGCLIPKTLKKISVVGNDMLYCMIRSIRKVHNGVDKSELEASFGHFINRLIDKMNPLVVTEVIKWDGIQEISEYLAQLNEGIKNMEDYKGLVLADDIFDNLPLSLSKKLQSLHDEVTRGDMKKTKSIESIEDEITPANPNLVRHHHVKKEKKSKPSDKVQAYTYDGDIDPFKNALHFIKYYEALLSQFAQGGRISFNSISSDSLYATQILDLLQEKGRSNKVFLNAWVRYFYDYKLKGNKALKTKYTSLKNLKETFEEYNSRYMEVQ
jgi:hypothetical protein